MAKVRGLPVYVLLLLPAALVVYFSFHAGGFFPRHVAIGALVLTQVLILYVLLTPTLFERLSAPAVAATTAMALFALWVLVSQLWSDAPGRSMLEFDRALMYLELLVLCVFLGGTPGRVRVAVRGLAAAITIVGVCALATRVMPDVWPTATQFQTNRLSWPLTYWNALGLLSVVGAILCLHLACSRSEPAVARVLGAAAVPALGTTVFFTFSRGPMWAGALGVAAYLLAARPRALVTGLIATVPATALAVATAYDADLLATANPTTAAAVEQGHHVARVVTGCVLGAAALRALLLFVDVRRRRTVAELLPARARQAAVAVALAGVVAVAVVLAGSGDVTRAYDRVTQDDPVTRAGDFRTRLTHVGSRGRVDHYRAAFQGFADHRLHGTGAGTFELTWQRYRNQDGNVVDAHSLYFESLSEMGVVGLALIVIVVLTLLGTALARARGPNRAVYGAVFAVGLAWAFHAGMDWDWEMPATTIPFIALGGLALGSANSRLGGVAPSTDTRLALGLACVACLVTPVLVLGSQGRMNTGLLAFQRGDCPTATTDVTDSLSWLAVRTEPYQVMSYCDLTNGFPAAALQATRKARQYDPQSWETDAWLAVARGYLRQDPRPAIRRAVSRNPRLPVLRAAARDMAGSTPRAWQRGARAARRQLISSGEMTIMNPY